MLFLQVRRFEDEEGLVGDMIFDESRGIDERSTIVDFKDPTRRKTLSRDAQVTDLLRPMMRGGKVVAEPEDLETIRSRAQSQLSRLHPAIRRFLNPHEYPAGMDIGLYELRDQMIHAARQSTQPSDAG